MLDAPVVVLTNVGLEHTRWLGPTVADIARGEARGRAAAARRSCWATTSPTCVALARARPARDVVRSTGRSTLPACRGYQRRNAALGARGGAALLGGVDEEAVRGAALATKYARPLPARRPSTRSRSSTGPTTRPGWPRSCARWPRPSASGALVACVSILDDKDAAGMLRRCWRAARPRCSRASANPRALPAATLASLAGQLGGPPGRRSSAIRARRWRSRRTLAGPDGRRRRHGLDLPRRRPAERARERGGRRAL